MSEIKSTRISREHYDRLDQRRRWLTNRIEAKEKTGWETQYDKSERDALAAALEVLKAGTAPDPGEGYRRAEGEDWKDERCEYWSDAQRRWLRRYPACVPFSNRDVYRIPIDPAPKHPPVPEGYALFVPSEGDTKQEGDMCSFKGYRDIGLWSAANPDSGFDNHCFYIRRIEPTYRPFASAEEFDSHAHRIVVNVSTGTRRLIDHYSDRGCGGMPWGMAHRKYRFLDDGSPFGVEVPT